MKQKISDKKETEKAIKAENPVKVEETGNISPEVIQNIELSMIVCNPFNPRKYRTDEDLEELKQSIVNFGIIQPVTLRSKDGSYEIVCGERRYRASLMAERSTIPAIIKQYNDEEAMEIMILENLQRRDINAIEEAVSFGKLMEVRRYSIADLVKQFGKTDNYIRTRLQLRNLIDEICELVVKDEISLSIALELSRFCPDIQKSVYQEHLEADDACSWKKLNTKDFCRMLDSAYSTDLSRYEFDKAACNGCKFNSAVYDLFSDGNCGNCQNPQCLRAKQAEFISSETNKLLKERGNLNICIAPKTYALPEVVEELSGKGYDIYEVPSNRLPVEPPKPAIENYSNEDEFNKAENEYGSRILQYNAHKAQIEQMVEEGKAYIVVDVSRQKPELCYCTVPEIETSQPQSEETVEKLQGQNRRNKEIAFEKGIQGVSRLLKSNVISQKDFSAREKDILFFLLLPFLRKDNYEKFGVEDIKTLSDEEKIELLTFRSNEQENILYRDFIIHHITQTFTDCVKSRLLLEFTEIHFPDKVKEIKQSCSESFRKKHEKIETKILALKPFNSISAEEAVVVAEEQPENEEFAVSIPPENEPDPDEILINPGLPEHVRIGEIPEEEEELHQTVFEEVAA